MAVAFATLAYPNYLSASSKLLHPLRSTTKDTAVLQGSARSGKTVAALQHLNLLCAEHAEKIARCFRRDATVAKRTLLPDLKFVIKKQTPELWDPKCWNDQKSCYTYPHNGSQIYLAGSSDIETLKGQRQHWALMNECTEQSLAAQRQIEARTEYQMIYDFNPSSVDHWIFTHICQQPRHKYLYLHSTFRDNPFLARRIVDAILKWEPTEENIRNGTASKWHWMVYGLGLPAKRPGTVFDYQLTNEWPDRNACQRYGYGLDFGFSIDPTALVECAYFQDKLYVRQAVYSPELITLKRPMEPSIPSLEAAMEAYGVQKDVRIWSDRYPQHIKELNVAGYDCRPVMKNRGEDNRAFLQSSIGLMEQQRLMVHVGSNYIINELENYTWKRDPKTEAQLNMPIDAFNHAIDAIRYFIWMELQQRRIGNPRGRKQPEKRVANVFDTMRNARRRTESGTPPLWERENPYAIAA